MRLDPSLRNRLSPAQLPAFEGETLFAKVARVVCLADCLPRKELYESWEMARRVRRRFRGGRVVDVACGHGLLAQLMILLDDTSPSAVAVDVRLPKSAERVAEAMAVAWPRLRERIGRVEGPIERVPLSCQDLVVSAHPCGALTDEVIARAVSVRARLAVLPCCHDAETCDAGSLSGWFDVATAIDATRVAKLRAEGYRVFTQLIPEAVTAKNRLLLAEPST